MLTGNKRTETALVNNMSQFLGIAPRGNHFSAAPNTRPMQKTQKSQKSSKKSSKGAKEGKSSRNCSDSFQLCLRSVCQPIAEINTAKYGYVLNPSDPPQPWAFSTEPSTGYLQIPLSAASSLGFDLDAPKKENGMIIANWISSIPPFATNPTNFLPADVKSALYTFVGLPSVSYPYWLLKPLNYLSNATKEWQPADWLFIQTGPYAGVSRIQFIDYATSMVWLEDPAFEAILKVCCDFCDPIIVKRCGPQKWYIKWGDVKCFDSDGCGSGSDSSDSESC